MSSPKPEPSNATENETPEEVGPKMTAPIIPGTGASPLTGEGLIRVIAIMCFLASLALGAYLAIEQAADNWSRNLTDTVTVQIKASQDQTASQQLARAVEILEKTAGITRVRPMPSEKSAELLEPWLGNADLLQSLPMPQLIEVDLDRTVGIDLEALGAQLANSIPGARLDDHRRWNDRLVRFAGSLQWLAFAVLALITVATAMIIVFATRADMAANQEIIEVLHLIGAKDSFIASQFQRHFFWISLWASLMGIGAAALSFLVMGRISEIGWSDDASRWLPTLALEPGFYAALLLIPILTIVITVLTARATVLRALRPIL
jgi:cell division transport system permease protein